MPESTQDWSWIEDVMVPDCDDDHMVDAIDDYLNGDLDESDLLALSEV